MQYDRYPFIDLAVHEEIRERFADGDALIVASPDLRTIYWANGQASDLFGYSDIYDLLEDGIEEQPALKRQIAGAIIGLARKTEQDFMIRVTNGFKRMAITAKAKLIELPGGKAAVLISSDGAYVGRTDEARGKQIISGFEGTDTHVAVLNAAGKLVAGSPSFIEAEIDSGDLAKMVHDVVGEKDRLIKRMVETPRGSIAAAIGRLTDDPTLHLVFAIEPASVLTNDDSVGAATSTEGDASTVAAASAVTGASFDANRIRHELAEHNLRPDQNTFDAVPTVFDDSRNVGTGDGLATDPEPTYFAANDPKSPAERTSAGQPSANDEQKTAENLSKDIIDGQEAPKVEAEAKELVKSSTPKSDFTFDPSARPVRFVWKINREGAFSEVSPEFAQAVGPNAADIIDRRFPDIARVFNLDPNHEITELLNRRDTWSGKTVNWPVEGTSMVVPVDMAALPTYTRERRFDGFRGFGIVRLGEAVHDDMGIGLALVPGPWTGPLHVKDDKSDDRAELSDSEIDSTENASTDHETNEIGIAAADEIGPDRVDGYEAPDQPAHGEVEAKDETGEVAVEPIDSHETGEDGKSVSDNSAKTTTLNDTIAGEGTNDDKPSPENSDPFRGEMPAIAVTPTAGRRESDKVIDLEARRARARDTLTPLEQAAFKEIGEKLGSTLDPETAKEPAKAETSSKEKPGDPTKTTGTYASSLEAGMFDTGGTADGHENFTDTENPNRDLDGDKGERQHKSDATESVSANAAKPEDALSNLAIGSRHAETAGLSESVVDMIPAALLVHIGDRLIHANPEFLELSGFDSLADISAAGGLEQLLGEPDGDEMRGSVMLRRADGEEIPVNARLRSINWHNSHALMLAVSAYPEGIDITSVAPGGSDEANDEESRFVDPDIQPANLDRDLEPGFDADGDARETETEARLRVLEVEADELRSILETATDGVVIIGDDNRIRSMNGSACALFGYEEAETREKPFAMLFAHESQRAVMDYLIGLAEHGVSSVLNDGREIIGHEANGGTLPLFMTIGRLSGSQGYCAVMRDITQWKRSEEELREAKRAAETANSHKSDFLARVSHEIRTPLNAIIGFSEMMVEERFGPIGSPRYLEYANDIGSSGKHVLDIVNDLLDISKIEAGEVELEFDAVSLNDQLAECVSMLQPMANSQRVIIRTSLSATLPEIVADSRSIRQIALNLLSNAVRYTPSGGQIVVSTAYESNGSAVLRIRDTGIGMSRKELEQAMKPFGQVGASARQHGDGTGLGLPLTKAMVEANRAQFDIVSAPKEGTLVTVTFPPQRVLAD